MSYVLCVSGSRDFDDYALMKNALIAVIGERGRPQRIMHGGAPGADALASRFAYEQKINLDILGAHWGTYGSKAGPIRNAWMATKLYTGDILVAFPSGHSKGTWDMVRKVNEHDRADIKVINPEEVE